MISLLGGRIAARFGGVVLGMAALWPTGVALAAPPAPTVAASPAADTDPLREAERSVVRVVTVSLDETGQPIGLDTGSGFVVSPGKVVTNHHVIAGEAQASEIDVFVIPERDVGGTSQRATISQTWDDADLALLAAPNLASPPIAIAKVMPGKDATVHALGYPGVTDAVRDLPLTEILSPQEPYVTPGSIALFSNVAPGGKQEDTIFHTAPINPGNSGGPLIDECGRVIGVNTWGAGAQLGANGEVTAPQGQFIASRASVLTQFLGDVGIAANLVDGPCVPAAAQTLDNRLASDETAIAGAKTELGQLASQLQQSASDVRQLSVMLALVSAALVLLVVVLIVVRVWPKGRKSAPTVALAQPAPVPAPPAAPHPAPDPATAAAAVAAAGEAATG